MWERGDARLDIWRGVLLGERHYVSSLVEKIKGKVDAAPNINLSITHCVVLPRVQTCD